MDSEWPTLKGRHSHLSSHHRCLANNVHNRRRPFIPGVVLLVSLASRHALKARTIHSHQQLGCSCPNSTQIAMKIKMGATGRTRQRSISEDQAAQLGLYNLSFSDVSARRLRFYRIGHAIWAVIVGCVAGIFTYWVRSRCSSVIHVLSQETSQTNGRLW